MRSWGPFYVSWCRKRNSWQSMNLSEVEKYQYFQESTLHRLGPKHIRVPCSPPRFWALSTAGNICPRRNVLEVFVTVKDLRKNMVQILELNLDDKVDMLEGRRGHTLLWPIQVAHFHSKDCILTQWWRQLACLRWETSWSQCMRTAFRILWEIRSSKEALCSLHCN